MQNSDPSPSNRWPLLVLCLTLIALMALPNAPVFSGPAENFQAAVQGRERREGMFALYTGGNDGKVFLELMPHQFETPFLLMASLARGVGTGGFANGTTLGTQILAFKRLGPDRVRLVRKNIRFQNPGGPLGQAVNISFADSPLMTLPITGEIGPRVLIELNSIFLNDFSGIRGALGNYQLDRAGTTWGPIKVFPGNIELRSNLAFVAMDGGRDIEGLADGRGVEIVMHYSLRPMPAPGFRSRLADPRVGYFTSVLYNFAQPENGGFVRMINKWRLEKADPRAPVSPAKKPIVFWIENTVPYEYRPYVRSAVEAWNRAFAAAGILNAIEVNQMPDDADWDPEDARYNTIRWTASFNMGFAIGPSRVNPVTGEILDADILIDANFVRYFERNYRLNHEAAEQKFSFANRMSDWQRKAIGLPMSTELEHTPFEKWLLERTEEAHGTTAVCRCAQALAESASLAGVAMQLEPDRAIASVNDRGLPPDFIGAALKELVMHEVGHTLGLRHNFKASTLLTIEELKDKNVVNQKGFCGSVMDYMPLMVAADPKKQGYYSAPDIGPYDVWAIRYGYTPHDNEQAITAQVASESARPEHLYGTDEDAGGMFGIDPYCRTWDLGKEPLEFAKEQYALVKRLWKQDWSKVGKGHPDDRGVVRQAFATLLNTHANATFTALDYIGGIRHFRDHRDDPGAREPVSPVSKAKMVEALDLICVESLGFDAFQFPKEVVKQLAPNRWFHWGFRGTARLNFAVADSIFQERSVVLAVLHDGDLLNRLAEIAVMETDALSPAEIFTKVTAAVWPTTKGQALPPDRRALQAEHLALLSQLWTNPGARYPREGRMLARLMLKRIAAYLSDYGVSNDVATDAHVEGMLDLAKAALAAQHVGAPR